MLLKIYFNSFIPDLCSTVASAALVCLDYGLGLGLERVQKNGIEYLSSHNRPEFE